MKCSIKFSEFIEVAIDDVSPDPNQPRRNIIDSSVKDLSDNLRLHGQICPILVIRKGTKLIIVDGERRWRAMKLAGAHSIRIIVLESVPPPSEMLKLQILANCQRRDLNAMELSDQYVNLMREDKLSATELATTLSRSKSHTSEVLSLQDLPDPIKELVRVEKIGLTKAAQIARLPKEEQEGIASLVASGELNRSQLGRKASRNANNVEKGVKRVSLELAEATINLVGKCALSLDQILDVFEKLIRECKRARTQGLDVSTLASILRDRAQAKEGGGA